MEYHVLCEPSVKTMEKAANWHIERGWQPHGAPAVLATGYAQAIVLGADQGITSYRLLADTNGAGLTEAIARIPGRVTLFGGVVSAGDKLIQAVGVSE